MQKQPHPSATLWMHRFAYGPGQDQRAAAFSGHLVYPLILVPLSVLPVQQYVMLVRVVSTLGYALQLPAQRLYCSMQYDAAANQNALKTIASSVRPPVVWQLLIAVFSGNIFAVCKTSTFPERVVYFSRLIHQPSSCGLVHWRMILQRQMLPASESLGLHCVTGYRTSG